MTKNTFNVEGMHCNSCGMLIEMRLIEEVGVKSAKIDFPSKKLEIEFDNQKIKLDNLKNIIKELGYQLNI